jgi:PAS domain S-box-containing protein
VTAGASDPDWVGLFRSMAAGVYTTDPDGNVLVINDEALRLLGRDRDDLVGHNAHESVHYQDAAGRSVPASACALLAVARTGVPARSDEDTFWRPDGSPLFVSWLSAPLVSEGRVTGAVVVFTDATQRHLESEQRRTREEQQAAAGERLALLGRVSEALSTLDLDQALRRLARLSVGRTADWCVVDSLDAGDVRRVALAHRDSRVFPDAQHTPPLASLTAAAMGPLAHALDKGRQQVISRGTWQPGDGDPLDLEQRALFDELGMAHALITPLTARSTVLGAMTWVRLDPDDRFTPEDVELAGEIARRAGAAVANARLFGQQRQVAETLQRSLLSVLPQPDHLHLTARYLPATAGAEVGGDWYDSFLLKDGATALVIGDILGHDLTAASLMGQVRNALRAIAYDRQAPPSEIVQRLDEALAGLRVDALATCLFARVEQDDEHRRRGLRLLRWTSAGHLPPALTSASGTVRLLDEHEGDLMLGVDPTARRCDSEAVLQAGDTLWLFTDGLVERSDQPLDVGLARLRQALTALHDLPLDEACDELLARMLPDEHPDDVAVLAVRAHPETSRDRPRPDPRTPEVPAVP